MNSNDFNADDVGIRNGNYFGFPDDISPANIVILNIPWDATTSYRRGTASGPAAMVEASTQLDFYNFEFPDRGIVGILTDRTLESEVADLNKVAGLASFEVIKRLEAGADTSNGELQTLCSKVNSISEEVQSLISARSKYWLKRGKHVILAGGEHSIPLGLIGALSEEHKTFGVLQIDAHADLRESFEGFKHSHASIMHNVLQNSNVSKIVQVGLRDVSRGEMELAKRNPKLKVFSALSLSEHKFSGGCWFEKCIEIVKSLPNKVYISFDIDGLDPSLCPNTGTPVPGGLTYEEAIYLIKHVYESGRTIIGSDLCEVAPGADQWDASVGARILYKLATFMHYSFYPIPK